MEGREHAHERVAVRLRTAIEIGTPLKGAIVIVNGRVPRRLPTG
jgi:hypothetical protein